MVHHTTTGEWQSFEVRMRRRRAERLLLRAQAAADTGRMDDALLCLSEARSLEPELPGIAALAERLSASTAVAVDKPTRRRVFVAVAVVATAAIVVLLGWVRLPHRVAPAAPTATAAPTPEPFVVSTPAPRDVFAAETGAARAPQPEPAAPKPLAAQPEPRRLDPLPAATASVAAPPPIERREPPPPPAIIPQPSVVTPDPIPVVTPAAPESSKPAPVPAPPPEPLPLPSQEPAVRSVLERYASAYSALDVAAAQRVWPGVNRGALARAFDSLSSQQVSLGDCRIDVAAVSATARCNGQTTWSPKIGGGGSRTEARSWTFELARTGERWEILSARVQNK